FFLTVRPRTFFERLFFRRERYERDRHQAEARYREAEERHDTAEQERVQKIAELEAKHEAKRKQQLAEIRQFNADVDEHKRASELGEPHAVIAYCSMVLERSRYPEGFPQSFRIAYVPDSQQLVIDYELPSAAIVPRVMEFRYVKTKDAIEEKPRKLAEVKDTY